MREDLLQTKYAERRRLRVSCCQSVTQPTTDYNHSEPCTSQHLSCSDPGVL